MRRGGGRGGSVRGRDEAERREIQPQAGGKSILSAQSRGGRKKEKKKDTERREGVSSERRRYLLLLLLLPGWLEGRAWMV